VARDDRLVPVDRRLLLLILAILLVIIGIGIGGLPEDDGSESTRPLDISVTTPTPTPTPPGGGGGVASEPTDVSSDGGSAESTQTPDKSTPTEAETPQEPPTQTPQTARDEDSGGGSGGGGGTGGGSGGGSAGEGQDRPSLTPVGGSDARIQYANLAPGDDGQERLILENAGNGSGDLSLTNVIVRADAENGVTDPEAAIDNSPNEGELAENLLLKLRVNRTDEPDTYLSETGAGPQTLAALANEGRSDHVGVLDPGERVEIVVDWRVPASTGNEIQSDGVVFDLAFTLRALES